MHSAGVDVGQKRDPTAIAVADPQERTVQGRTEYHYLIRHLERLPLGTSYPSVARRVGEIYHRARVRAGSEALIYVDATGVGAPIVDMLRDDTPRNRSVKAVYFTHGDRREESRGEVKLGKAFLVSRLQVLLQMNRLHLPQTSEANALAKELLDYEIRVDENANDKYGAFRVGCHDDMVTAVGLAVQLEPRRFELIPLGYEGLSFLNR